MKSMTGFGRGQFTADGVDILAEVRSVNHRFLECTVRLPRAYSFLEEPIKKAVQQVATRGKVEVNLTMQLPESATNTVAVNVELANAYCQALQAANETLQLQDDLTLSTLLRLPDVCTVQTSGNAGRRNLERHQNRFGTGIAAVCSDAGNRGRKAAAGCVISLADHHSAFDGRGSRSSNDAAELL